MAVCTVERILERINTASPQGADADSRVTVKHCLGRWCLRNRPLSKCDQMQQQKAEKDKNRSITESELIATDTDFELTVATMAGDILVTLDRREASHIHHVKAAVAKARETQEFAGIRLLLGNMELGDSVQTREQMKFLQVIFTENYVILMRMKGNMKHKFRIFGIDPPFAAPVKASDSRCRFSQTVHEQTKVWAEMGCSGQLPATSSGQIHEDQVRPYWAGGAFVLVTKEHAKYVKRAIERGRRDLICTTTTVIISPPLKYDFEILADEYIKATEDECQGWNLKDLKRCFPRDTSQRITLDPE